MVCLETSSTIQMMRSLHLLWSTRITGLRPQIIGFIGGLIVGVVLNKRATKKQQESGKYISTLVPTLVVIFVLPILVFLLTGMPLDWDLPLLKGFN